MNVGDPHASTAAHPEWEQLEILVAAIQKEIAPGANVQHNVRLPGLQSETERQVDVLIEQNVGQYTIRIVVDCKDYSAPVDVKGVEEFYGLVQDVGAHKGALVCPKGFTRSAKKRAKKFQIDLYSPVDTEPHKWQVKVTLPVLCDFRSTSMAFGIRCSAPLPLKIPNEFFRESEVFDGLGNAMGTPIAAAIERWNSGQLPIKPGDHEDLPIFPVSPVFIDNGYGTRAEVGLTVSLRVTKRIYIGHLPIERIRGLKDEQTGLVVTNAFTTGHLDPTEVENRWTRVEEGKELPFKPAMIATGLDCWRVGGESE